MKKTVLLLAAVVGLAFTSCNKNEDFTCKQKVERKVGADWVLINSGTWEGDYQYKNYVKAIDNGDGTFTVIRTTVTCD